MNTNHTRANAKGANATIVDDRICIELSELMSSISRGSPLEDVLAEVVDSVRRSSGASVVRFRVYSSDLANLIGTKESGSGSDEDSAIAVAESSGSQELRDDLLIADGCYFTRPESWRQSSGANAAPARLEQDDKFWFPILGASGKRSVDLEVLGTKDGSFLVERDIAIIRLLTDLAGIAVSKVEDISHYRRVSDGMKERTSLLEDLLTISSSIVSERSPDTLSNMILTSLSTLFGFQRVSLIVFDDMIGEFRWKAAFGYPHEATAVALSRTIPSDVVLGEFTSSSNLSRSAYFVPFEKMSDESRKYIISPDTVSHATSFAPRSEGELREGDSLAFVLKDSAARIVGAIYVSMPIDGKMPDKETIETIEIFTSLAEVAMEDARLTAERETALRVSSQRTEQLSRIFDLTSELMYVKDLDHLLDDVLKTLAQLLGLRRMVIGIRNEERDTYVVKSVYGYPQENVAAIKSIEYPTWRITRLLDPDSVKYPKSPVRWRKKMGRGTYYVPTEGVDREPSDDPYYPDPDLIRHPRKSKSHWHELDYMDTYIFDREGGVLAYIEILRPRDDRIPDAETIEVIEIFASLVGIAIENSRLFQSQVESRHSAEFFTDLLSHDIKNFNQAIMGYLDMLRVGLTSPDQSAQIDKIAGQVMNVNRLANDVRTMSRLTWGGVNLQRTDIGMVLMECIQNSKMYDLAKQVEIVTHNIESQRFFVNADELLRELFMNILTNAIRYDPNKAVTIEASLDRHFYGDRHWLTVSISDRGCGIPDEVKESVFERFAKGIREKGSSGLGLHIVSMLTKRYRGRVWIEDRVKGNSSEGSVFKLRLPEY